MNKPTLDLYNKLWQRMEEDFAFIYSDFVAASGSATPSQLDALVETLHVDRLDTFARWHLLLVPELLDVEAFVTELEDTATSPIILGESGVIPAKWKLVVISRISYWKGKALERSRNSVKSKPAATDEPSARKLLGDWLRVHGLNHTNGARKLAVGETVLSALKRGSAIAEKRCARDTVKRVAEQIECAPESLDQDY